MYRNAVDTLLEGENRRTCRTKVRRPARQGGGDEAKGEGGGGGEAGRKSRERARVTESIVEAYWESANSPGFNLTGEPWTPFNIQARTARRLAARASAQRNRHVKHHPRASSLSLILGYPHSPRRENERERKGERERGTKVPRYSILVELLPNPFWFPRDISLPSPSPRRRTSNFIFRRS